MFDEKMIRLSRATSTTFQAPIPEGRLLIPFQQAGVEYASLLPSRRCMLADEPGLGKTIQAIAYANYMGFNSLLVICPAALRFNWLQELQLWSIFEQTGSVILSSADVLHGTTNIISYDLATEYIEDLAALKPQLLILDEAHYLKNPSASRTKAVLKRLVPRIEHVLALSGTPAPNRVHELFSLVRVLSPNTIDRMSYRAFMDRYAKYYWDGERDVVVGIKNPLELQNRLRSSFMVRRFKKDVLKDLPDKFYKMVVFPADATTSEIIAQERQFDAETILRYGSPIGSNLPELRR